MIVYFLKNNFHFKNNFKTNVLYNIISNNKNFLTFLKKTTKEKSRKKFQKHFSDFFLIQNSKDEKRKKEKNLDDVLRMLFQNVVFDLKIQKEKRKNQQIHLSK